MSSTEFYQSAPELQNSFQSDPLLKKWLQKRVSQKDQTALFEQLNRCGEKAVTTWLEQSVLAESQEPQLISFDPWGRRQDLIQMSSGWQELEKEAAREGIIATAYARKNGALSRSHQMALLYLFHPSSAFVSCPLAMTDGAARCLELLGHTPEQKQAFQNLTSFDPKTFWTSGQWMTEKSGGSDVSGTATVAIPNGSDYKLFGTKWFTSATTSQMSLALAKEQGSDSLTLFYVELRDHNQKLKNIEILRLKDKLGTRALPTAELCLKGTPAQRVGESGQGVKNISTMLNITRTYNAVCSVSHMRRGLDWLQSYSQKRKAFGRKIADQILHLKQLQTLEKTWAQAFVFTFRIAELLGKDETQSLNAAEKIELRLMTPILKLWTARECVLMMTQICEGFGGAGYIEDTGIPKLLRDAQVFSIWEGTTHVLALDFLRAMKKEVGSPEWLQNLLQEFLKNRNEFSKMGQRHLQDLEALVNLPFSEWEEAGRELVLLLAAVFSEFLLMKEA